MGEITFRKALNDYQSVYMAYRKLADRTREEYINERYVAWPEQKGFVSVTRKRKVVVIRSFLSFLYQDGYIAMNKTKSSGTSMSKTIIKSS